MVRRHGRRLPELLRTFRDESTDARLTALEPRVESHSERLPEPGFARREAHNGEGNVPTYLASGRLLNPLLATHR